MLSVTNKLIKECRYSECHYAECRNAEGRSADEKRLKRHYLDTATNSAETMTKVNSFLN